MKRNLADNSLLMLRAVAYLNSFSAGNNNQDKSCMIQKKPGTIIWDFDGTLLPNDPYDSEQSLMMYKLYETGNRIPFVMHALARTLLYADQKEHLRKIFKQFYIRFMKGSPISALDRVCERLAAKISDADRHAVLRLAKQGHHMIVLSCGTVNLSEIILEKAGLIGCFKDIAGNRFETKNGQISGMTLHMPRPEDKVRYLVKNRIPPGSCVAIGDGYTDIPMLDWAGVSVLVDRTGSKQKLPQSGQNKEYDNPSIYENTHRNRFKVKKIGRPSKKSTYIKLTNKCIRETQEVALNVPVDFLIHLLSQ